MSYSIRAGCTNCGKKWKQPITKGTSRTQWEKATTCPNCGIIGYLWTQPQ